MSSYNENILLLGAGELGMPILRELSKPHWGHHVTILLRPAIIACTAPQKQKKLAEIHDLGLAQLFKGFHTIISATGYVAGPGTQLKLARAVLEAQIPRYIPWQFGVDYETIGLDSAQETFDEQLDVRALLCAQTRTEWVIISTTSSSPPFSAFFGVVGLGNAIVHALGGLGSRITVTAVASRQGS